MSWIIANDPSRSLSCVDISKETLPYLEVGVVESIRPSNSASVTGVGVVVEHDPNQLHRQLSDTAFLCCKHVFSPFSYLAA